MSSTELGTLRRYDPRRYMLQLAPMQPRGVTNIEAAMRSIREADEFRNFARMAVKSIAHALGMPRHLTYSGPLSTQYSHCKGRAWPKTPRRLRNLAK